MSGKRYTDEFKIARRAIFRFGAHTGLDGRDRCGTRSIRVRSPNGELRRWEHCCSRTTVLNSRQHFHPPTRSSGSGNRRQRARQRARPDRRQT